MANITTLSLQIRACVKTTAEWTAFDRAPAEDVLLFERTENGDLKWKIGNGVTMWSNLRYGKNQDFDPTNFYTKAETNSAINTAIANLGDLLELKGTVASVDNLPSTGNEPGDVYFVGVAGAETFDMYSYTVNDGWVHIGYTGTDMSIYYTKTEVNALLNDKVDKVTGKQLSTEDFTSAYKGKLDNIDNVPTASSANFVKSGGVKSALDGKVDKVAGKGLSTNDYTTAEKNKLAGLSNYDDTAVNNNMVRAGTADANGQNQLFKTIDGTSTNIDPVCSLSGESILATALKTATILVSTTVTTEEGWYQLAEWDISDVPSTYYFGYNLLFVINGSKSYTAYGNATLKAICYGKKSNVGDATKFANKLHLMSSSRVSGAELPFTESMFKLTFKMDSTTKNITYKLWWHEDPTQLTHTERFSISLAMANDGENSSNRNIAYKIHLKSYPDVNYQIGATGYLENDSAVLAVDCAVADVYNTAMKASQLNLSVASRNANSLTPLLVTNSANATESGTQTVYKSKLGFNAYNKTLKIIPPSGSESTDEVVNISGNAATATKLSGAQTVLYESTTNTNSFTLSGLFTDWSAVMIYLTGAWASGTSGTHGFFVPLNYMKNGNTINDFCGSKEIIFFRNNNDSISWSEHLTPGGMTYSKVIVVGLY